VNVWFQRHHLTEAIRGAGWLERLLGAGAVIWFYLSKALLPLRLLFVYPQWQVDTRDPVWWLPLPAAALLSLFLRRASRPAFFAWGYFLISLVPVMGFVDVYFMKFAPVADHYQHLAIIGVAGFFGWWLGRCRRPVLAIGLGVAVCLLAPLTWARCRQYRDSRAIFQATLEGNPASWLAHVNLGFIQLEEGNDREAQRHFMAALALNPKSAEAHCDLGITFLHAGRSLEASGEFEAALRLIPSYPQAENGLGLTCLDLGREPEAILHLQRALRLRPNYPEAHNNLGLVMVRTGRLPEAISEFAEALRIKPDYANARSNLEATLALRNLGGTGVPPAVSP
jgi:Flp pilus assembly protein TadD